ncbi:hypothetical protein [Kineococcus gypseus]|uniref:hypothetical protein n=1 Tax=Kineococcus gypseus TaxID=1637102 RepID=UPI003D7E0DB1
MAAVQGTTPRGSRSAAGHRSRLLVRRLVRHLDAGTAEPALADRFTRCVDALQRPAERAGVLGGAKVRLVGLAARHPLQVLPTAVAIARLPRLGVRTDASPGGLTLRAALTQRYLGLVPVGAAGLAVLEVPATPGAYRDGASRQTLRRKVRAAERRGTTWRLVHDPAERRELLVRAEAAERAHRDARYRSEDPDNSEVLEHDLWLVAEVAGEPVLLSVTPTAGEWGSLRYFRTLGSGPAQSDARYYALAHLVDELARRGVRHLLDATPPLKLTNGLRHFQRMVGFRYARVHLAGSAGPAAPAVAPVDGSAAVHGPAASHRPAARPVRRGRPARPGGRVPAAQSDSRARAVARSSG